MTLLEVREDVEMYRNGYSQVANPAGTLVFLGTYTNYEVLAHFPKGHERGEGIVVCRWRDGKLHVLHTVPCLNPAFMK